MSILSSVALGWFGRRIGDWGGWIAAFVGTLVAIYSQLDPGGQHAVMESVKQIATGRWREIPLGQLVTVFGVVSLVWSQRKSYKATTTPQIVTPQGDKVELKELTPAAQRDVTATAERAPKSTTVLDMLLEKLNRNR